MRRSYLFFAAFSLLGCGSGDEGSPAEAARCDVHAVPAPPTFVDRTLDWGLASVVGNRFMVSDLDGDGYPDVIVHRIYSNARDDGSGPATYRVLMNRLGAVGGRVFVDETEASNYGATRDGASEHRSAQLAVAGDVDDDGDVDLFSGTYTDRAQVQDPARPADLDRSEILLNDGAGHFTLGPALHPEADGPVPTSGATFADVDRDGHLDLFIVGWYSLYGFDLSGTQARLHRGAGDGTFTDVTAESGLTTDDSGFTVGTNSRPAYGTTSCDADGDGDADLLVSAYGRQWNQLYQNDGGHFSDVGQATGYAGDDDTDYSDNEFFRCWCTLHASEDPHCAAAGSPQVQCPSPADSGFGYDDTQPWRLNGNTFSTACADVTGDGVLDLYNAEIRHWWAGGSSDGSQLLVGDLTGGALHYARPGVETSGLAWPHVGLDWNEGGISAAIGDVDLDGRKDVLVGATDYPDQFSLLFHQLPDGTFEEVGPAWGLHHACGNAVALADFDRDGDLDALVGSGTARDCAAVWSSNEVHLYENDASARAHWLGVRLAPGAGSNRSAIGARVSVSAGDGTQIAEVGGGYGHFGLQGDLVQHFGLGACTGAAAVDVRWPDAALSHSARARVAADQILEIGP